MSLNFGNAINKAGASGGSGDVTKEYVDTQDRTKLNKQQDVSNIGKYLVVGANGIVIPEKVESTNIVVNNADFGIITGNNVQSVTKEIDTKLSTHENYASVLLSLDVLNDLIGGITEVPEQSLQTQMVDGRPSHKEKGAIVYDEFGTIGILDIIENRNAIITTITTGSKPFENPIENYYIEKNPITGGFYVPVGSNDIRNDIIKKKFVRLLFDDTITNTGEQSYDFQTFDKQGYAVFRRNIVEADKVERINIKVDYQGTVTFIPVEYSGVLYWSGTSSQYNALEKQDNTMYRITDTNEVYLGTIKLSV